VNPAPHTPVLPNQVLSALAPRAGQTFVDCTAGFAGHALLVARVVGPTGCVVLNDADPGNLAAAGEMLRCQLAAACPRIVTVHGNFADLPRKLTELGLRADMLLADLGFASNQVDQADRGFSFMRDGPLDMRMNQTSGPTAAEFIASADEGELVRILQEYGEEPAARRIARKLVQVRAATPMKTTAQLAELVREVIEGKSSGKLGRSTGINPATRTFQAIRIAVNDELGSLDALLAAIGQEVKRAQQAVSSENVWYSAGPAWLEPETRLAIISFHSLEDRPVKRAFAEWVKAGWVTEVHRGVEVATEDEIQANPRSRSAKLRVIQVAREKLGKN
jgi:16S rRNA (cytosine1402-N4)-methyltransferase